MASFAVFARCRSGDRVRDRRRVSASGRTAVFLLKIYAMASLAEGLFFGMMYFSDNLIVAIAILVLVGIPESIAYITYYTILSKELSKESLANYHSITLPFYDLALYLGVVLSGLLVDLVSMNELLLILIIINTIAVLLYVPVFFAKQRESRRRGEETYL
jgi:predicted MFS family arabinose efflux permease